eukprot:4459160-Amphidinium_carterae.1
MQAWASTQTGVKVVQLWSVNRVCYSAQASLLDALELALEVLPPWGFALFVSPHHYPIRPRFELARFLWYHPMNFAASDEARSGVDLASPTHIL